MDKFGARRNPWTYIYQSTHHLAGLSAFSWCASQITGKMVCKKTSQINWLGYVGVNGQPPPQLVQPQYLAGFFFAAPMRWTLFHITILIWSSSTSTSDVFGEVNTMVRLFWGKELSDLVVMGEGVLRACCYCQSLVCFEPVCFFAFLLGTSSFQIKPYLWATEIIHRCATNVLLQAQPYGSWKFVKTVRWFKTLLGICTLGGGFKDFLFSPLLREMIQFD